MKASDVMKAAKQWFKLSNYDVLQEITVSDLKRELVTRLALAEHDVNLELDESDWVYRQIHLDNEAKILAGQPCWLALATNLLLLFFRKKNFCVDIDLSFSLWQATVDRSHTLAK